MNSNVVMNNNNALKNYNSYICYLLNKYKIPDLLCLTNSNIMEYYQELLLNIIEFMLDYINSNLLQTMYYDIYDEIYEETYELFYAHFIETDLLVHLFNIHKDASLVLLHLTIKLAQNVVFKFYIPKRSYKKSYIRKVNSDHLKIKANLFKLKSCPQPEQRTPEWYIFRNSTLTASNIYKIFISESTQSQLIIEKCCPSDASKYKNNNLNSPMHWGQKYERVSVLYYEHINNTKVSEFGCIPHSKYSYIAASPDGIICDENSPIYGRMLEIKNVVSREINGTPKMEYWIQMQIQMEVCDLNECDFLETKFLEYSDLEEYKEDYELNVSSNKHCGFIMQFSINNEDVHYEYPPFNLHNIESEEYIIWTNQMLEKNINYTYVRNIYWKLETISCVLVLRNKLWFTNIQPYIETFWNALLSEKNDGSYVNRISNKRKARNEEYKEKGDFYKSVCLIKC
jgi:putative phage-type endonuclease